jgi:minichromosome maintenance protein 10
MHGRYYLSPSTLYSIVRLAPNKQAYDVPVDGDYVIIAVVAERGPVRVSKAPVGLTQEVEDVVGDREEGGGGVVPIVPVIGESMATNVGRNTYQIKDKSQWKGKGKAPGGGPGPRAARKYVNLKLIDFGARSSSSATGGKAVIRGDAFLSLLLFESESVEDIVDPETKKKTRMYRGGSRGAFEHMATLREGSVVALLNPRVLRPFQVGLILVSLAFSSSHLIAILSFRLVFH